MVETKNQLHEFRNENGASLRRITPSTQVGRLSGSHSDIDFQVAQFPSWEGRWGKRKVKRSAQRWTQWSKSRAAGCNSRAAENCGGKPVCRWVSWRRTMEPTNSGRVDHWSQCVESRYVLKASLENILTNGWSFVGSGQAKRPWSPCFEKRFGGEQPFGTGFDAHTVPLCGAPANDLNRYLKSLRNKRKKHSKSSARAREKGRSRKKWKLSPWLG